MLTDLVPTLLEAAGVDQAKTVGPLDGVSLMPLFGGGSLPARTLCWHFPNYTNQGGRPAGAIRDGDWKLVEQFEDGSVELFNLAQDVGEANNLAESEPARADELRRKLKEWRESVGARMPRRIPILTPRSTGDCTSSRIRRDLSLGQPRQPQSPSGTSGAKQ